MTQLTTIIRKSSEKTVFTGAIPVLFWLMFIGNLIFTSFHFPNVPEWKWGELVKFNGFSALL